MVDLWLSIAPYGVIDTWLSERHYLGNTPLTSSYRMWFLDGNKQEFIDDTKRLGAMLWGKPTNQYLDQTMLLELYRMYFIDDTEPNIESKSLAMSRKWIRNNVPRIKGLLAYSSTGQKHEGTIYLADNWFTMGKRKSGDRRYRPKGNKSCGKQSNKDNSDKVLWVRSP